jgi:hypothetical protein
VKVLYTHINAHLGNVDISAVRATFLARCITARKSIYNNYVSPAEEFDMRKVEVMTLEWQKNNDIPQM